MQKRQSVWLVVFTTLLLAFPVAQAAEGLTSELQQSTAPDAQRESRYVGGKTDTVPIDLGKKHGEQLTAKSVMEVRPENPTVSPVAPSIVSSDRKTIRSVTTQSIRASNFYFYSASSALLNDRDQDGYHSELKIRFDADTEYVSTRVFAKLYLRRIGDNKWSLYHVTDDFTINGHTSADDYTVITTLDAGYPTADYDVLIDLYEVSTGDLVATIDPSGAGLLGYLPLEEAGLDLPLYDIGVSIGRITTTLLIDSDHDDYYSRFRIDFNPAAQYPNQYVYAKIWVRPQGGEWLLEHTSNDIPVDLSGSADTYSFTADWLKGYPTALYDVQIDLYDSVTELLVASAGSERPELSRLPLEDAGRDVYISPPAAGGVTQVTVSSEYGGGAMTWWSLIALGMLAVVQRILAMRAALQTVRVRRR